MRGARLTTRRMMAAVLLVALVLGGAIGTARLLKLRAIYLRRAESHAGFRSQVLATPESIAYWEARWTDQRMGLPASDPWPAGPPFVPAMAAYRDRMRAKWERAARLPWLPVEPDPIP